MNKVPCGNAMRRRAGSRTLVLTLGLLIISVVAPNGIQAAGKPRPVRVMTQNLYLGADLVPAFSAGNPFQLAQAASEIWWQMVATDFPARAKVLAAEIADAGPILVAVQEAALWRAGMADGPPALGGTPAETIVYDFLDTLLAELAALGAPYELVQAQPEVDVEAPTILGFDIRLTQYDAILVKTDAPQEAVALSNPQSANFASNLTFSIAGLATVSANRGWVSVDATVNKRSFRLVATQLEAYSNFYRTVQALELLAGPLATPMNTVLVGDLNSSPDDPVFLEEGSPFNSTNPYDVLTTSGFSDSWLIANPLLLGFTCCNAPDLLNPVPTLDERIDHVLTRPAATVYRAKILGTSHGSRTPSGLWPSDHAGVLTVLAP